MPEVTKTTSKSCSATFPDMLTAWQFAKNRISQVGSNPTISINPTIVLGERQFNVIISGSDSVVVTEEV